MDLRRDSLRRLRLFPRLLPAAIFCILCTVLLSACAKSGEEAAERFAFGVVLAGNEDRGNAYSEAVQGYYDEGTEITAHAAPRDGYAFDCWTAGAALEDGGTVLSYAKDFTFSLSGDLWLYPNFREHDGARLLYHANGGAVTDAAADPEADVLWTGFSLDYYLYPNALPEMGYFTREGYTLTGYSTAPDGSGAFYSLGGKVFEDTDAVIELWCVWREQSPAEDFTFARDDALGGWIVTAYTGPGGAVTVPDVYDGEPVVGLAEGAFAGSAEVTELILPSSLRVIEPGACSGMTALGTLLLFDSLDTVSDASFEGDTALDTVYISAATNPRYSDWFNNHSKKIELMRYWSDGDRPMLVILGGSSVTYAVDALQLESLLDREYIVLNCGTNGSNIFTMAAEWAMHFMREGDFLLQIFEYSPWQLGGTECAWQTFRSFEGCYNVFSWVPISRFEKFFDCFQEFLEARKTMPEESYEDYISNMAGTLGYYDIRGTLTVTTKPNGSEDFWQGRKIRFSNSWLYQSMIDNMNGLFAKMDDMGLDYAMAYTPLSRNALYDDQSEEDMAAFQSVLKNYLNVTILGDLQTNLLSPTIFYDDDYHLASPARAEYTERLAADLNEFFASRESAEE